MASNIFRPKGKLHIRSHSADETRRLAARVARQLKAGDILLFVANLGSGKTTFIQGLARGLGVRENALSPTFVLAETYQGRCPLHHLDFYRLNRSEILGMGVQDYLLGLGEIEKGVVCIEWADRCREIWPKDHLEILIQGRASREERDIILKAKGPRYKEILQKVLKS